MAARSVPYAHRAYARGGTREAVLECLERNIHTELTARDVARLSRVAVTTTIKRLRELREEGLAHSRQNVTHRGPVLLWGRVAV